MIKGCNRGTQAGRIIRQTTESNSVTYREGFIKSEIMLKPRLIRYQDLSIRISKFQDRNINVKVISFPVERAAILYS